MAARRGRGVLNPALAASAALVGLASAAHCMTMCGAFSVALAQRGPSSPLLPGRRLRRLEALTHAGRLTTYAVMGALAGGLGAAVLDRPWVVPAERAVYVLANALLLLVALSMATGVRAYAPLARAGAAISVRVASLLGPWSRNAPAGAARYAMGTAWGLVPCAAIYSMLPVALFAGGVAEGALLMGIFGAATLPTFWVAGTLQARLRRHLGERGWRLAAAAAIAALGSFGVWRALTASDELARGLFCAA